MNENKQNQNTSNQKTKKMLVIIGSITLVIAIALGIANACIPTLTRDEVKELVIAELQPQIDQVEAELGVSNITVDFEIHDYKYKKPTLFTKGQITFKVDDYYVSNEFTELDDGIYTAETCEKYRKLPSLNYYDIDIPKYEVHVYRRFSSAPTGFKDSSGDEYSFDKDQIFKNGNFAYGESEFDLPPENIRCNMCDGTGKVNKHYGNSWNKIPGYGYGDTCGDCGGTGRIQ